MHFSQTLTMSRTLRSQRWTAREFIMWVTLDEKGERDHGLWICRECCPGNTCKEHPIVTKTGGWTINHETGRYTSFRREHGVCSTLMGQGVFSQAGVLGFYTHTHTKHTQHTTHNTQHTTHNNTQHTQHTTTHTTHTHTQDTPHTQHTQHTHTHTTHTTHNTHTPQHTHNTHTQYTPQHTHLNTHTSTHNLNTKHTNTIHHKTHHTTHDTQHKTHNTHNPLPPPSLPLQSIQCDLALLPPAPSPLSLYLLPSSSSSPSLLPPSSEVPFSLLQ